MSKKFIGILVSQSSDMIGVSMSYIQYMSQYGDVVLVTPNLAPEKLKLDLLVLPGGADIDTGLTSNGRDLVVGNGIGNPMNSQFYSHYFKNWVDSNIPILGICLGAQAINVCLGGGITPDGPNHTLTSTHPIAVYSERLGLARSTKEGSLPLRRLVNSRHHQFIQCNQLAEELIPIAFGTLDDTSMKDENSVTKLLDIQRGKPTFMRKFYEKKFSELNPELTHVEGFIHSSKKIAGVQWHPEDMWKYDFQRGELVTDSIIKWLLDGQDTVEKTKSESPLVGNFHNQIVK